LIFDDIDHILMSNLYNDLHYIDITKNNDEYIVRITSCIWSKTHTWSA